jgi:hypothetical protein
MAGRRPPQGTSAARTPCCGRPHCRRGGAGAACARGGAGAGADRYPPVAWASWSGSKRFLTRQTATSWSASSASRHASTSSTRRNRTARLPRPAPARPLAARRGAARGRAGAVRRRRLRGRGVRAPRGARAPRLPGPCALAAGGRAGRCQIELELESVCLGPAGEKTGRVKGGGRQTPSLGAPRPSRAARNDRRAVPSLAPAARRIGSQR